MSFNEELSLMLEYCDYTLQKKYIINSELQAFHSVYPNFQVEKGWSEKENDTISITGTVKIQTSNSPLSITLSICFPLEYPDLPPLCRVVPGSQDLIVKSQYLDGHGMISIKILREWNRSQDCLDIIQHCCEYFEQNIPIINIENTFISEMWRVRTQIDELCKEKSEQLKQNAEIKKSLEILKSLNDPSQHSLAQNLKSYENWTAESVNKTINVDQAVQYKHKFARILVNTSAKEEAYEETARKIIENFNSGHIVASDFVTHLKNTYKLKFLTMKKSKKF